MWVLRCHQPWYYKVIIWMFICYFSLSSGNLTNTSSQICGSWYLPVHPKDKDDILQKRGVIYRYKCGRVDCEEEYIGESGRTFAERFREHMKVPSPIHGHFNITGHEVSLDNFSTVGREDQSTARAIREAMLIRVNDPSLNRNIGKYQLPYIWDEVLVKSPELKLKQQINIQIITL